MEIDQSLPNHYHVELADALPRASASVYYFPDRNASAGKDGLLVNVIPSSRDPWTGVFAFGRLATRAKSGIYTGPGETQLCVVSRGSGYIVNVEDPSLFTPVEASPVIDVRPIVERTLIVFATPWELLACGTTGLIWRTGRISVEGLKILEVNADFIRGEVDRLHQEGAGFFVDLENGLVT